MTKDSQSSNEELVNLLHFYLQQYFKGQELEKQDFLEETLRDLKKASEKFQKFDRVGRYEQMLKSFKEIISSEINEKDKDNFLTGLKFLLIPSYISFNRGSMEKEDTLILPGSLKSFDLIHVCQVCKEEFEIPGYIKTQLYEGNELEKVYLHHDNPLKVKIIRIEKEIDTETEDYKKLREEADSRLDFLLGIGSDPSKTQETIISVGIDIGSSTTHLIFSKLLYLQELSFFNLSNRFQLASRKVLYEGNIINTPLINSTTIDTKRVIEFIHQEYKLAGIRPQEVDTGVVIITGESAKKSNAKEIVDQVADDSGKFVSSTAGPNFESVLGALGSGMVELSERDSINIANIDIGGGTSNLAFIQNGEIVSTACISVGGRLLGIDQENQIWKIDEPASLVLKQLNLQYGIGDKISNKDLKMIVSQFTQSLVELILGEEPSEITKGLMMTPFPEILPGATVSFSGGVGELFYHPRGFFDDIGLLLAEKLKQVCDTKKIAVIEPVNKIKATVIGAGSFSLTVSGSTTFVSKDVEFPIKNVPVLPVAVDKSKFSSEHVEMAIQSAFRKFDIEEGNEVVALYFREPIYNQYSYILKLAEAISISLTRSIKLEQLVILLFGQDLASLIGIEMNKKGLIKSNLVCIDELNLKEGDWIDIGTPLKDNSTFPVTVKSLVFR